MADNTTTRIPYQQNNPISYQQQPIRVNQPVRSHKKKRKKKAMLLIKLHAIIVMVLWLQYFSYLVLVFFHL